MPVRHTPEWYERLSRLQAGYFYPWRSKLPPRHGEDVYRQLVEEHLRPDADVLDSACGHGELARAIAPRVRSVLGYDLTAGYIDLARRVAQDAGLANATFIRHDSSAGANGGQPRVPAPDGSFDLLICSKGPFHWMEDARRVARPGATLLMLVPDSTPVTPWHADLPEPLRWELFPDPHWARPAVERRLEAGKLSVHSWWSFDVPEVFPDPVQLYAWLAWGYLPGEVPSFAEVRPTLERIFAAHAGGDGLPIRYRRYAWKAEVVAR